MKAFNPAIVTERRDVFVLDGVRFALEMEQIAHRRLSAGMRAVERAFVAHNVVEPIAAICGFALGRSVDLPPMIFLSEDGEESEAVAKRRDPAVLTLARKGVSLDLFSPSAISGGIDWSARARASLITFDAGMRQERDSVARTGTGHENSGSLNLGSTRT